MIEAIAQTDPQAAYLAQRTDIDAAIARVLTSGRYVMGSEVADFETEFAAWQGTRHAVGLASGTDALVLGLKALGVGPADRVVTVSHTAVATVAAIELAGATPILIDIDQGYGMDMDELAALLARVPVKAIIAVHLYGQPVALDRLQEIAEAHDVAILEDCSQAHGALHAGVKVGRFGKLAAFSLYPTKNLGAIGDGGVLTTDDHALAQRVRELRQYGWTQRRVSERPGYNSRLDEIQAAILRVKLTRLDADNRRRRHIAADYDAGLGGLHGLELPWRRPDTSHVFHQYVVRHDRRDALAVSLQELGVGTGIHYPLAVHEQPAYRRRLTFGPGGLARTEHATARILSLPMFPQMNDDQIGRVIDAVREACVGL